MPRKRPLSILLLGEAASGKTALFTRLERGTYSCQYRPSIGADFIDKDLNVGNRTETVRIWDSPGRPSFPSSFGWQYWREANCCVLVYDITNRASFRRVELVREEFLNEVSLDNFPFVVVGNKADREKERQVGWSEAQTWARKYAMPCLETSAKDESNVLTVFEASAELAFRRMKYLSSL